MSADASSLASRRCPAGLLALLLLFLLAPALTSAAALAPVGPPEALLQGPGAETRIPQFDLPGTLTYSGRQLVIDWIDRSGIGAGTRVSFSAVTAAGEWVRTSAETDEAGRVTACLDASGLPDHALVHAVIEPVQGGPYWAKRLWVIREGPSTPAEEVPRPWLPPEDPSPNLPAGVCSCPECAGLCSPDLFTYSEEPLDHGVQLVDGSLIQTFPVARFDSRQLGFQLDLHHQAMVRYSGPVGEGMSHTYNFLIVQTDDSHGSIVTPDLRVFPIQRLGPVGGDPAREEWSLPEGFYSRLHRDSRLQRWILTHHRGCQFHFLLKGDGLPGRLLRIEDTNGNRTEVRLDSSGQMRRVTTDLGQEVDFAYDEAGRLTSLTDHLGRSWTFGYTPAADGRANLTAVTTPASEIADLPAGAEITDTDLPAALVRRGRTTTFRYGDPAYPHHITRITDPRGAVPVEYAYYGPGPDAGRVAAKVINGRPVTFLYRPPPDAVPAPLPVLEAGNGVVRVVDREGNVRDTEFHGPFGSPGSGKGRFGLRRTVEWTARGLGGPPLRPGDPRYWERRWFQDCDCLLPREVSQPFASDAGLSFDGRGMPVGYPREVYEFNDRRQVTAYEYRGEGEVVRWERTYAGFESFSRELTYAEPRAFDASPLYAGLAFTHAYAYDARGNRVRHDAPLVTRGTAGPQVVTEAWAYNAFGQLLAETDANGNRTTYEYFPGDFTSAAALGAAGDLNTRGTFGGYLAGMTRGAAGSADPAPGLTARYRVNALGMVTERTDPNGRVYATLYNDLGETVAELDAAVTLRGGGKVRYENRHLYDAAGNRVLTRRSNVDADGTVPANAFLDRSQSFDAVGNLLSSRAEVDGDDGHDLVTRYRYDGNDQLAAVEQPEGNRTFHLYDERRLRFKTFYGIAPAAGGDPLEGYPADKGAESLGGTPFVGFTRTAFDARRNPRQVRDGRGFLIDHFYDFYNRRTATSDPNSNGMVYAFDDASNVVAQAGGGVAKGSGQLTAVLERTYFRYDELGRRYQEVRDLDPGSDEGAAIDPDEGTSSSYRTSFDPGSRVMESRDANGNPTSTAFDAADRTLAMTDALGNLRRYAYDPNSNLLRAEEVELPGPGSAGAPETYVTTYAYDELNRRTESHVRGLDEAIDHPTFFAYDSRGNTRLVEDAEGNVTLATFDDLDRVVRTQRFDADPFAAPAPTELIHYEYRYDGNSRKTADVALSDVADPASAQLTRYAYDHLDRLVRTVYPDADDPIDGSGDGPDGVYDRVEVIYDANSNVAATREQRGVVFANAFDPGNRLLRQEIARPPSVPGTSLQAFAYDALNRLTEASNDYARVGRSYDPLSRLASERQELRLDGSGFTAGWERPVDLLFAYDRQSNRAAVEVVDGTGPAPQRDLLTVHAYDALNRVAGIDAEYFDRPLGDIADYAYLGPWRVQTKTYGNGVRLTEAYDAKRRLAEHAWREGSPEQNLLAGFQYAYDDVDNPLFERFLHDQGRYDNYAYNDRYELTAVSYREPLPRDYRADPGPYRDRFVYDDNFNRREATFGDPFGADPPTHDTYAINPVNEYTAIDRQVGGQPAGTSPPLHDPAGNSTRLPVRPAAGGNAGRDVDLLATWDAYNLLFTATVPDPTLEGGDFVEHYRYDPFRRRIARFDLSQAEGAAEPALTLRRYVWDGWSCIEERTAEAPGLSEIPSTVTDRLERIYVNGRAIDEPLLAAIDGDGDGDLDGGAPGLNEPDGIDFEYYYLNNRLGSVMGLVGAVGVGEVLEGYRYGVYGEAVSIGPPSVLGLASGLSNSFLFSARRSEPLTGVHYFRARNYSPAVGRFTSRDPLEQEPSPYAYARARPSVLKDPLGLQPGLPGLPCEFSTGDMPTRYSVPLVGAIEWKIECKPLLRAGGVTLTGGGGEIEPFEEQPECPAQVCCSCLIQVSARKEVPVFVGLVAYLELSGSAQCEACIPPGSLECKVCGQVTIGLQAGTKGFRAYCEGGGQICCSTATWRCGPPSLFARCCLEVWWVEVCVRLY